MEGREGVEGREEGWERRKDWEGRRGEEDESGRWGRGMDKGIGGWNAADGKNGRRD